jgi:glycosyltransferase involved in cell wall biosynthesis
MNIINTSLADPPVKLAVIFDQLLSVGGGYQQALNIACQVTKIDSNYCKPIFFTNHHQNISILKSHGIDCHFLGISIFGRAILKVRGIINSQRLFRNKTNIFGLNKFERILLRNKVDLVYFISPSSWANYLERLNFIITVWDLCHRDQLEFPEIRVNRTFEERELSYHSSLIKATAVIADSDLGKENIIRRYGVDEERIHVMSFSPALGIKEYVSTKNNSSINIKEKYKIDGEYIFYPAQFWAHKNHIYILQGLQVLNSKYGIRLNAVFSGNDGGNLKYVKKRAQELDLLDQVFFIGFIDDEELPHFYQGSIALVMPTYFGPTNIPPLEAFVLGVPVLYSDLPGLRDQVEGAALLMDLLDPESMAINLNKLINDMDFKEALIKSGHAKILTYKYNNQLNILENICHIFQRKYISWDNN